MFYIVSYDISDDERRNRTSQILLDFGRRVHYSVFECVMSEELLVQMMARLGKAIGQDDSIRIYTLCAKCLKATRILGRGEITRDEDVYVI